MKTKISRLLVCLTIAACAPALAQDDGLNWHDNYKDAMAEAKKTGKPIFLEYRCEP